VSRSNFSASRAFAKTSAISALRFPGPPGSDLAVYRSFRRLQERRLDLGETTISRKYVLRGSAVPD
jgi:hypothetical protein